MVVMAAVDTVAMDVEAMVATATESHLTAADMEVTAADTVALMAATATDTARGRLSPPLLLRLDMVATDTEDTAATAVLTADTAADMEVTAADTVALMAATDTDTARGRLSPPLLLRLDTVALMAATPDTAVLTEDTAADMEVTAADTVALMAATDTDTASAPLRPSPATATPATDTDTEDTAADTAADTVALMAATPVTAVLTVTAVDTDTESKPFRSPTPSLLKCNYSNLPESFELCSRT
jgi:hypothetical protein